MAALSAALGLTLVCLGWLHYLWLIPQERVPARPIAHALVIGAGVLASLGGVALGPLTGGLDPLALGLAAPAVPIGLFFHYLLTQAALPDGEPTFDVGAPSPAFTARTAAGENFESDSLRGHRVLLKLFRGSW